MTGSKEFSKRSGSIEGRCVELEIFFFFEKYREDANRKEKKRIIDVCRMTAFTSIRFVPSAKDSRISG